MYDLSILIPARNEMFLSRTVDDLLKNIRGNTEIIVVLDGEWADPPLKSNERLTIIYNHESIGQRAATNQACRLSRAKYVMKVDAHCSFDEGFDVKMMSVMKDHYTLVPLMRNLHVFDWVCKGCQHRIYQGPTPDKCPKCGGKMEREILWRAKESPRSTSFLFDTTLHFQYWGDYKKIQDTQGDVVDTLSIQGSCFMLTRKKYWELNICDENFGSWGQQGVEVACKTWLSGGEVKCYRKTWYAHMFRTQGGDFGFPYPLSGKQIDKARAKSRVLFVENTWDKQIYPLSWLLNKFKPVPYWHEDKGKEMLKKVNEEGEKFYMVRGDTGVLWSTPENKELTKGIIYFTDNQLKVKIAKRVQKQLESIGLPIVSASLKPMTHFGHNIHVPLERGYLTMFKQILAALEASTTDVVFFCEHDVLYHPSHFDFIPEKKGTVYYNVNVWKVRSHDGHALWVNNCRQVSGICAFREDMIKHYKERIAWVEKNGFHRYMGFEPGTHNRVDWEYKLQAESRMSQYPNIDIRHDSNLTANRWSPDMFRDKRNCEGWTEKKLTDLSGWSFKENTLL